MMKQTDFPTEQMPVIDPERGCCVTIGNFDGVHKGHQTLISHALEFARKVGMACVIVTFWPHPRLVLGKEHVPLMTRAARLEALQALQPDHVWEIPFNRLVAGLSPEDFVKQYLVPLSMRRLVVGHDFSLGKGRAGQPCILQGLGRAYGYTMEKIAYKPLRNAPRLSPLISAIGMSTFLQNYVLLAQTPDFVPFPMLLPDIDWLLEKFNYVLGPSDFFILVVSFTTMIGLMLWIRYTRMGKAMRATAQNRTMAMLLGIDANHIISVTFIVGSALAALGGVLIASHMGQINFGIGFLAGMKAFTAAVLGGIGSVPGAVLGGLTLGLAESFTTGYVAGNYEDVLAFCLLILILIFRPDGILGKHQVQKV